MTSCLAPTSETTRFGFVSSYPPTICGLATFTSALMAELAPIRSGTASVVRVVDAREPADGGEVAAQLVAGDPSSVLLAARVLDSADIAIVQHEYGVYGGADGEEILQLLRALTVPVVVVLHTVLTSPTAHQRLVLEAVVSLADAAVTMTSTARDRLSAGYAVDMSKVSVIPHGARVVSSLRSAAVRAARPTILTWGLIGPGKGIEWGIEAMSLLGDLRPAPRYLVAGRTHPKVLLHEGEAYRSRLARRVVELDLTASVTLDGRYRDTSALAELIDSADIVLLPYDSVDQVTSGVLIEAVAALKPVVATRFSHAVELLGGGAGILVPHHDPRAIADSLRTLLTQRDVAERMAQLAGATAPELDWPAVAARYRHLAERLILARAAA